MAKKATKLQLNEFEATGENSALADPVTLPSSARPADQHQGDLGGPPEDTKSTLMFRLINHMSGLEPSELNVLWNQLNPGVGQSLGQTNIRPADKRTGNQRGPETASDSSPTAVQPYAPVAWEPHNPLASEDLNLDFSSDIDALVKDTPGLTEEFKTRAKTIFEAAVGSKVVAVITELKEKAAQKIQESQDEYKVTIKEGLDKFLDYAVDKWAEDNQIALETSVRTEQAESLLQGLRALLEIHNIELPDEKVDVAEGLAEELDLTKNKLDEVVNEAIDLKNQLKNYKRDEVIDAISIDMTDLNREKLRGLSEAVSFDTIDEFSNKVAFLKEQYFGGGNGSQQEIINEELDGVSNSLTEETSRRKANVDPAMAATLAALKRTVNSD